MDVSFVIILIYTYDNIIRMISKHQREIAEGKQSAFVQQVTDVANIGNNTSVSKSIASIQSQTVKITFRDSSTHISVINGVRGRCHTKFHDTLNAPFPPC